MSKGWIGVDLDGTLAHYDKWEGAEHIGEPIPLMVNRVKRWLKEGKDVRIMTARVAVNIEEGVLDFRPRVARDFIDAWCMQHIGQKLPVTHMKDFGMIELWDDRCVQVEKNTGRRMDNVPEPAPLEP